MIHFSVHRIDQAVHMDVEILTESCESIGSDSDQTMEIDRNHNIDKSVQCLTSLDSTTFPQVVNRLPSPSLYPYVNIKINRKSKKLTKNNNKIFEFN